MSRTVREGLANRRGLDQLVRLGEPLTKTNCRIPPSFDVSVPTFIYFFDFYVEFIPYTFFFSVHAGLVRL